MRKLLASIGAALLLSACVADLEPEAGEFDEHVAEQGQALDNQPGNTTDGTACCAKDYRDGNGETVVCGTRDGGMCCNADGSFCASCSWYECEPPPVEKPPPSVVKPPGGGVYAP